MKFPSTRLRRNRKSEWSRRLINDTYLDKSDFILPIFVCEGKNKKQEIKSMPGIFRYSIDRLDEIISRSSKNEIPAVAIFPLIENSKKNNKGTEALNKNNVVCNAIHQVKKLNKNIGVMCDVALDPYTSHGHDGLIINNEIDNDETNKVLIKQALIQAQAGCDIIAPSDMMDGRIGLIRNALEKNKFINVQILSYAVKYASNFYSPFRDAVGTSSTLKSDKKTYQMDYKNSDEALLEVKLDKGRGVILVKGKSLKVINASAFNAKSVIKDQIDKTLFDKSTIENNYGKRAQSGKVIKNYKNQIMNRNFENNIRCHLQ